MANAQPKLTSHRSLVALRGLTIASLKMYFRNRTGLFFSLFFPVVFIVVFGLIFKNASTSFKIDVSDHSNTQLAQQFVKTMKDVPAFKIKEVSDDQARDELNKGDADLTVTIPESFGRVASDGKLEASAVAAKYNEAKPQTGQAAAQIISQLAYGFNDAVNHTPKTVSVEASGVKTQNLSYIDFLLPGMVGLSIMQLGIFSVAFGFITYKTTGMLRRIQATPIHPGTFLTAQGLTRLIMTVLQTSLLVGIGIVFFNFHLNPASYPTFLLVAVMGSAVFMAFGFAIAGWAKNEDQAQPVAQLIQFPMMFLSGTFFSRDSFPALLQTLTAYLPLTFLADALRHIANDGASLWAVRGDVVGLVVWGVVAGLAAVKLFRWE